jgi:hypothetical protein
LILGLFEWLLKQASLHHHDQQAPPKKTPSQNRKKEAGQPENTRADLSFKAIIKSPNRAGKDEKTDTTPYNMSNVCENAYYEQTA